MCLIKLGILKENLDYHLIRAAMVIIFLFFGYQKWFEYEAQVLISCISNGPLMAAAPKARSRGAARLLRKPRWMIDPLRQRSGRSPSTEALSMISPR